MYTHLVEDDRLAKCRILLCWLKTASNFRFGTATQGTNVNLMFNLPNLRYNTRHFRQLVVTTATYDTLAVKLTLAYRRENIFVK